MAEPLVSVELVRYDAACRAISQAKAVDEVKMIRDTAEAMRAYARQAKNKQLEIDCAEIRIRAERRVGELMAAGRQANDLVPGHGGRPSKNLPDSGRFSPATCAEVGIDKPADDIPWDGKHRR